VEERKGEKRIGGEDDKWDEGGRGKGEDVTENGNPGNFFLDGFSFAHHATRNFTFVHWSVKKKVYVRERTKRAQRSQRTIYLIDANFAKMLYILACDHPFSVLVCSFPNLAFCSYGLSQIYRSQLV
jgi:hypothetical protein